MAIKNKAPLENLDVSIVHYTSENQNLVAGGLNSGAAQLIAQLPNLTTTQLTRVFEGAVNAERVTFVIRGAAAYELVSRRLKEVERFTKKAGQGADSICNTLGKEVGIEGPTLYKDYRIFEEFGGRILEYMVASPEKLLPREMYGIALHTNNNPSFTPLDVLDYFEEQREVTGGYFIDHARRDSKKINEGMTISEVRENDMRARIELIEKRRQKSPVVKEPTTKVEVPATPESNYYMLKIIDKYASFSSWFLQKSLEEFGKPKKR